MRGIVVTILLIIGTAGCCTPPPGPVTSYFRPEPDAVSSCQTLPGNVRTFPVNADGCREFIVVVQDWNYPIGFIDHDGKLTMITSGLNTLGQIDSIRPSPESSRVLIESHGEGHQFISIYDVAVLVKQYAGVEMVPAVKTLDPYPYAFSNMKWIDSNTLQFDSVSDFNHFDAELRRGKYSGDVDDETVRTWKWQIAEDKFEEIRTQSGAQGKPASSPP